VLAGLAEPFPLSGVDRSVIILGQGLGLCAVAEGVENETSRFTRRFSSPGATSLRATLARPIPIADIPAWLVSPSASGR
jgi:predicted signal transduction protein with EAL and GGDEF domain